MFVCQIMLLFYLYFYVDCASAFSEVLINVHSPDFTNIIGNKDERYSDSFEDNSELIGKALEIVERNKNGVTAIDINKCLSMTAGTKNKLNCVRKLIYKHKSTGNRQPYKNLLKYKEDMPHQYRDEYISNGFLDLTKSLTNPDRRLHAFSDDYLDIKDLLRSNSKTEATDATKTKKNLYVFKVIPIEEKKNLRRFRDINDGYVRKKILRTVSEESSSSGSEESTEAKRELKKVKVKLPKRFEVIDKSESDDSDDVPMQRPIRMPKSKKPVVFYMQAPTRVLKIKREGRRRLTHFLPKRYHWSEKDMRNLRNHWFSGPQGKYWGHYRTPH